MSAPAFLNKPKHKDNVIATSRGWVVEKTGELLVSVKNLDQRIAEHLGLPTFAFEPVTVTMEAPVVQHTDTTLPTFWQGPHTGGDAEVVNLPHTGGDAQIALLSAEAPVTAAASIDSLLDSLDTAKPDIIVEDIVKDVVEEVKEEKAEPVVEKKKRGGYRPRKPKVTE